MVEDEAKEGWEGGCMNLGELRVTFIVVTAVLTLLVASPALSYVLVYPRTEFFTELWLLGPEHMAEDYPFNVSRGQSYSVYLGVGNQLGYCAYYVVEVKFRNESQPAPDSFNQTSSGLPSLFNVTAFVADEGSWELPVTVSFDYGFNQSGLEVEFHDMRFNDVVLDLGGLKTAWNSTTSRFYGNLLFELWLFNATSSSFQYHERYVDLKLNMTY
jgi:hypothetical protein